MENYTPGSAIKVLWICSKNKNCSCHVWEASICNRTGLKNGCPFCLNQKVCEHHNLETEFPHLKKEWSSKNVKKMSEYAPHSSAKRVWWECSSERNCGCHIWECSVDNRTGCNDCGCPFCSNNKTCECSSLEALRPALKKEWDPINGPMSQYAVRSNKKVSWICSVNSNHRWEAVISGRTDEDGRNCPHCSVSRGYSNAEIEWLKDIEKKEGIKIRKATDPEGQFMVPGLSKVDGYCESNNTIYEYFGDYWHGNPLTTNKDDYNERSGKTNRELYEKTVKKCTAIQEMGYNLVVKWETEYIERGPLKVYNKPLIIKK